MNPPLSDKQLTSVREATGRVNIWDGSIRSGKTIGSLLRFLIFVASAPHGGAIVVIGRTRDSIARNVFGPLQDATLFGRFANNVHHTQGAPTATILGRKVYVIGASDAKAEMVIRGLTVAGAYVDEATVIPEAFFTQLLGRMSVPGAQLFATTNPDSPAHWLKRKFLDRIDQLDGWTRFQFRLADNPSLTTEYVDRISSEFTGLWYRRFILGEWVAAEGAIFDMWDPDQHVIAWEHLPRMQRMLGVGIDYGTTNATSAILLGLSHPEPDQPAKLFLIDEWRHDPAHAQTRLTDGQLSAAVRDWMTQPHMPPHHEQMPPQWTIVDPAAASFKVQLHKDGARGITNAENNVGFGIRTVATLLGAKQLLVSDRCTGFIQEAPGYSWDPKATQAGEDKPVKVADHSLDAGRYAIATTETMWRQALAA